MRDFASLQFSFQLQNLDQIKANMNEALAKNRDRQEAGEGEGVDGGDEEDDYYYGDSDPAGSSSAGSAGAKPQSAPG